MYEQTNSEHARANALQAAISDTSGDLHRTMVQALGKTDYEMVIVAAQAAIALRAAMHKVDRAIARASHLRY